MLTWLIILGASSPCIAGFLGVPWLFYIVPQFPAEYCLFITELLQYRQPCFSKRVPSWCFYGIDASEAKNAA